MKNYNIINSKYFKITNKSTKTIYNTQDFINSSKKSNRILKIKMKKYQ